MKSNYSFKIYTSTKSLPSDWNTLATNNIFLSSHYLNILEISPPKNMKCNFIGLFHNDKLVGMVLSQFLDLSEIHSFGGRDHCLKTKIRNFVFKNFITNVLFIGNNMLTGQNAFYFSDLLPIPEGILLLNKVVYGLKKDLNKKGIKIHLTIFKDFNSSEAKHFNVPEFKSFFRFSTQPNMIFQIKGNWNSFDDYINNLSKKYRVLYKRAIKKSGDVSKKKMSLLEITNQNKVIYELYLNVAENAPFNTFYLPENHFEIFKKCLKNNFLFYGYFMGDKLIGFNTLIKNGADIDTYFLGYDENFQRDKMLYLNMLYDMIGYSINKGYNRVIFARTALEIKSSVGAKPIEMFGFIAHSNYFINLFMSKAFVYFEPKTIWQERNPFN